MKYTDEDRKRIVEERGYELLEISREKRNNRSFIFITVKCTEGHISKMKWNNFQQNKNCKYCANNVKFTYEYVKEYIESFNYKLLSEKYVNLKEDLIVECPEHHKFTTNFNRFKNQNSRCPICSKKNASENRKHDYNFIKEMIENYGYKLLSTEYKGVKSPLLIKCPDGHEFEMSFDKFNNSKHRCTKCSESKGEREVRMFLDKYEIKYVIQYRLSDCKFYYTLPFDFYLPDYNCCIEYDGEQHFEIFKYFGGLDKFIDTKIRDTVKNEYCKKNNIKLIRIPYWNFNEIEEILKRELELK